MTMKEAMTMSHNQRRLAIDADIKPSPQAVHPVWQAFIRYCGELQHGEIEVLKIQNGLPMLAEVTKKKVKFGP